MTELTKCLLIVVAISFLVKIISCVTFFKTLKKEDHAILVDKTGQRISLHSAILICIVYIADFSVFVNSAIIVAITIKEYL